MFVTAVYVAFMFVLSFLLLLPIYDFIPLNNFLLTSIIQMNVLTPLSVFIVDLFMNHFHILIFYFRFRIIIRFFCTLALYCHFIFSFIALIIEFF